MHQIWHQYMTTQYLRHYLWSFLIADCTWSSQFMDRITQDLHYFALIEHEKYAKEVPRLLLLGYGWYIFSSFPDKWRRRLSSRHLFCLNIFATVGDVSHINSSHCRFDCRRIFALISTIKERCFAPLKLAPIFSLHSYHYDKVDKRISSFHESL